MKKAKDKKQSAENEVNGESLPGDQNAGQNGSAQPEDEVEIIETAEPTPEQKYADLFDRYQRSLAEFDNFRKRMIKEKAARYDDGVRETAEKILPVADNIERALNSVEPSEDKFYQGVVMIARQFETFLSGLGVEEIEAGQGTQFNHNLHFAVAHAEDESFGENEIIEVLQKGYRHKEKIIRPSMVRVAN